MSTHIHAVKGDIAETVFISGDPLRARWVAETFLHHTLCYNTVRGMLGYTGITIQGKRISVQGTGIGMPSTSLYVSELIDDYDAQRIIRIGSAGALQHGIPCKSVILAMGSCSASGMNLERFPIGTTFAPMADWELLFKAYNIAKRKNIPVRVGNNYAADKFYGSDAWKTFAAYGVLTVEMETAELYTLAAQKNVEALTLLTISDNVITGEELSPDEREKGFSDMVSIALEL